MKKTKSLIFLTISTYLSIYLLANAAFAWQINSNGVNNIVIGKPIPAKVLKEKKAKFAKYIADFVPFNGYQLSNPPIAVGLKRGQVNTIIIETASVETKAKIGVGSTLKDLKDSYGKIDLNPVPPTLGKDEAAAHTPKLNNVYFYFKNIKDAENGGKIVRIIIFKQ
jgi:hypothetical protein